MQFRLASFFAIVAAIGVSAQLQINTPACPSFLPGLVDRPLISSVLPGGQPSANALVTFPQTSGTSVTWVVNIQEGTSIGLTIRDSTGAIAQSAPFTIGSGSDSSCLSSSLSVSAGSSTAAGSTTSGGASATTTAPTTTSSGATTGGSTTKSSSSGSSTSSAASSSSSSAAKPFAQIGSAGVIGAVVAALFA